MKAICLLKAWKAHLNRSTAPPLPGAENGLQIQPCREELCQMPVAGMDGFFSLFASGKDA